MSKCLEGDLWVAGADKVEQLLAVFADEGFLVAASDVVPLDAIVVEVVQNGQARLTLLFGKDDFQLDWLILYRKKGD